MRQFFFHFLKNQVNLSSTKNIQFLMVTVDCKTDGKALIAIQNR
jgi:hypothetical protein